MGKLNFKPKLNKLKRKCLVLAFLIPFGLSAGTSDSYLLQQNVTLTGTVSDNGTRMPGVTVTVKGTTTGTQTNSNGEFTITVPDENSVLEFRFLGYQPQEVLVGSRRIINVEMIEDGMNLEEVTVVAFGKQKKESVIGAITTINPSELKTPSSNLTTSLAGQMAGIIAYQRSGEPGQDNADFFVRGITTFGAHNSPLILIDGIELTSTDLARLQPDDIASFSIMKDATATALYGARGANGVILVTTKQGAVGPAKVQFRFENSFSAPTKKVQLADPVTFMTMNNEAVYTRMNMRGQSDQETPPYSQQKIENTMMGIDPIMYPSNDWMKMLMKDFTTTQRANLSVSGGGGVARYFVAASLNHDNGMFKVDSRNNFNNNIDNTTYTLRSNVNIDLTKSTELIFRFSGAFDDYSGPLAGGSEIYRMLVHSNPVEFLPYYDGGPDYAYVNHIMFGNWNRGSLIRNPYAEMVRGYKEKSRSQVLAQVELKQGLDFITEGLMARGMLNLTRLSQFSVNRFYIPFYYSYVGKNPSTGNPLFTQLNDNGTEFLDYEEINQDRVTHSTFYFEGMLNYDRTFNDKHSVSGLLVYQMTETLKANTGSLQLSLPARNIGLSGRATYSFDRRYFAEFNFGYNGSERFHKSHRFGFFPSAGAAWMVSNEAFWENIKPVISNLKLRYSYGLVGNDRIGRDEDRFFYLSQVNMRNADRAAVFGTELDHSLSGISVSRYANPDISWEKSRKQNIAVELGFLNKLTVIAEYFTEQRSNILMERASVPKTFGLYAPVMANIGKASGKGVDLSVEYQHIVNKDFWASARGNFTYARSKYTKFEEPAYEESWRYRVGYSINQRFGYIAERLFVDDEEAANSPRQYVGGSNSIYGGGDVKYLDVNGDGVINDKDMVPIGYPEVPEIVYGFGLSIGYKQFDFSAFFQGAARQSFWINAAETSPFYDQTQVLKAYANNYWSEERQNVYALWPRLSTDINSNNVPGAYYNNDRGIQDWGKSSTWFMRNGAFLRLKQVEIGYTIPKGKWHKKANLTNIRIYASGTNLFLLSKFKLWDVEMGDNGLGYPLQRVFNIGINVTFN